MLDCPFWALIVHNWILAIFTLYEMNNGRDTFFALIPLPGMFLSRYFKKNLIGLVTMGLLYIRFTYLMQDNQQRGFRLSNGFTSQHLGLWMNHLPPVWWPTFRFMFLNDGCCVRFSYWSELLLIFINLILVFIILLRNSLYILRTLYSYIP